MELQEGICKLCLKKCERFRAIDENTKNALDILLLKIDFTVIQEPVMCKNCAEMLMKCFDFKVTCLRAHDHIVPFANDVKLDLKDVYQNKDVASTSGPQNLNKCGFCMNLVKKCFTVSLNVEEGDVTLKKMIEQCLPELDLSILKNHVICAPCLESLENCSRFITNCLIVEEKTREYCETLAIDNKGQIKLSGLLQFRTTDLTTGEVGGNLVDKIKVEHFCEDRKDTDERKIGNGGDVIKFEQIFFDNGEVVKEEVENKNESFTDMDVQKVNGEHQVTPKNMKLACEEESDNLSFIKKEEIFFEDDKAKQKDENLVEMKNQEFLLDEKIEIKTDEPDICGFEDGVVFLHPEVVTRLRGSPKYLTPNPEALLESHTKHSLTNENTSKKKIMYHCECCPFQTKYKYHLKSHLLVHKDLSDVTIYKCNSCTFQTKYKRCLEKHLLLHKELSEVTVYKCDSCSFKTKHKKSLNRHLLLDPLNEAIYKCNSCSFQTRYNLCFKNHLLLHKDPLEVKMYKCDFCSHQTKHKKSLYKHLIVHKDPSELTMYKCTSCPFQTKHKNVIKKHLQGHTSEVTMYKCDSCSFQTKTATHLKSHTLVHKDPSEIIMHNCDSCSFQTKRKETLKRHLVRHKKPSEVTMYKCKSCSFQTKLKYYMKHHHELKHKRKH